MANFNPFPNIGKKVKNKLPVLNPPNFGGGPPPLGGAGPLPGGGANLPAGPAQIQNPQMPAYPTPTAPRGGTPYQGTPGAAPNVPTAPQPQPQAPAPAPVTPQPQQPGTTTPATNMPTQQGNMPWQLPDFAAAVPGWSGMNAVAQGDIMNKMNVLAQNWAVGDMGDVSSTYEKLVKAGVPEAVLDQFITGLGGAPGTTGQATGVQNPIVWKGMPGFYEDASKGYKEALGTLIKDAYRKEQNQLAFAQEGQQGLQGLLDQMTSDPLAAAIAESLGNQMSTGSQTADADFGMRASEISNWEQQMMNRIDADKASRGLAYSGDLGGTKGQVMSQAQQDRLSAELERAKAQEAAKERARAAAANWYAANYGMQGTLQQNIAGLPMGYQPTPLAGYMPNLPSETHAYQNMDQWIADAQKTSTTNAILGGVSNILGQGAGALLGKVI